MNRKLRAAIRNKDELAVLAEARALIVEQAADSVFVITLSSCLRGLASAWQISEPVQKELGRLADECAKAV